MSHTGRRKLLANVPVWRTEISVACNPTWTIYLIWLQSQGVLLRDTPQTNLYIAQPKYMALKLCKICNKRFSWKKTIENKKKIIFTFASRVIFLIKDTFLCIDKLKPKVICFKDHSYILWVIVGKTMIISSQKALNNWNYNGMFLWEKKGPPGPGHTPTATATCQQSKPLSGFYSGFWIKYFTWPLVWLVQLLCWTDLRS